MKDFANEYSFSDNTLSIHHSCHEKPSSSDFSLHRHKTYEIYLFLSGDAGFLVEGTEYPLASGDMVILNHNELHNLKIKSVKPYERIVMQLSEEIALPFCQFGLDFFEPLHNRPLGQENLIPAVTVARYGLDSLLRKILDFASDGSMENQVLALCTVIELLFAIKNATTKKTVLPVPKENNTKISALLLYINENLGADLSLDTLAAKFFISKFHLCHLFKESTGFSVGQYIILKRVLLADQLIASGYSITNAALSAGFSDYSSFYKAYKKEKGHSPKKG